MKLNEIIMKADKDFKKMLNDIKIERIKINKDTRMLSDRRLTLAMTRLPNIDKIKDFIINSEIKDDRRRG